MVAGLLIGGVLLSPGHTDRSGHHAAVLGAAAVQFISELGQVGMILYVLLVGLTLSPLDLRRNAKTIAAASLPLALAAVALAPLGLYCFSGAGWHLARGSAGVVAMAAVLTISGFPFIARILQERDLLHGDFAVTALGSSAVLTTLALLLLAVAEDRIRSIGRLADTYPLGLVGTVGIGIAAAVVWGSLAMRRPLALGTRTGLRLSVIAALVAAWLSSKLLGTPLLGAFLVGIALSQSKAIRRALERALGWSVPVILVPVFLADAGARVAPGTLDFGVLTGAAVLTVLLLAVGVLGAAVSSRFPVLGNGNATALAALLNCRGVMLVALGVEMRDHRLIGSKLVGVFFICAIATTIMTGPLFARAQRLAHRAALRNGAGAATLTLPAGALADDAPAPRR
jgi:Kef-type K+ transport system membrane component KefB